MKSNIELLKEYERLVIQFTKEENFRSKGVTKKTASDLDKLEKEVLKRMGE